MAQSELFVSLNCFEALNTSVVEAMAAGCIVFTYEGFGPRDYLRNGENAYVFSNNEAYALCSALFNYIDRFNETNSERTQMRNSAKETAQFYSLENMEKALLETFKKILAEE